ncbi:MAG: carbohydrate ABC transporter permease [Armatimonadota bacterium]|nr:carbohydrate ABC transporter permease [Armatimonadota bacterium]
MPNNPFFWILSVLLAYLALTVWGAHTLRAFRQRARALAAGLLALPLVTALAASFVPSGARLILAAIFLALGTLGLTRAVTPREAWVPEREARLTLLHLVLLSGSALFLVPFVWLVVTSLKTDAQIAVYPPVWVPHPVLWRNYPDALKFLPASSDYGLLNLVNTLIIAILSVIGTVLSSSFVAYGFARMRWPGKDWLFGVLLATMMLPDAVTMMPRFLIFRQLHWIDTLLPLWVPSFFASAFSVFLMRQFFMGIPQELEDAAKIDGCGPFTMWWRVMMPLVKPALAAVTIMTFLGAWKDFLGPLIYISSPEKMPLSYVLQLYNAAHGGEPGLLMAATTLVVLPVIVLFFFTQRYFIEGVSFTGLGGR